MLICVIMSKARFEYKYKSVALLIHHHPMDKVVVVVIVAWWLCIRHSMLANV